MKLKYYVRLNSFGKVIPGTLVKCYKKPKLGYWKEVELRDTISTYKMKPFVNTYKGKPVHGSLVSTYKKPKPLGGKFKEVCQEIVSCNTTTTTTTLPLVANLTLSWDNIINAPVPDPTNVADWNTWFGDPLDPFTSVVVSGNSVTLIGGTVNYIPSLVNNTNITEVIDNGGTINLVGSNPFIFCTSLINISLPNIIYMPSGCFNSCYSLSYVYLPKVPTIGNATFGSCTALTHIDIRSCTNLGGTPLNNNVFNNVTGCTINLTIHPSLLTCNGGAPDGDIQWLQSNNTVTIITG